ncbi:MAG: GAF domain-containing protein [Blastochloris sp.]|nr:GAF domain-containing protein [Blastochloris sp.]
MHQTLAASLNHRTTLQRVARLLTPTFCDYCVIYLTSLGEWSDQVVLAHRDADKEAIVREIEQRYPREKFPSRPGTYTLNAGVSEVVPDVTPAMFTAHAIDAEHLRLLQLLAPRSVVTVPLLAGAHTLGVLTLVSEQSGRYQTTDVASAEELARKIAVWLDNARLYRAEQQARMDAEQATERVARLQAITAAFSEALTPAAVADVIVKQGSAALNASFAIVSLTTEDGTALRMLQAVGPGDQDVGKQPLLPLDTPTPVTEAVRTKVPVLIETAAQLTERYPQISALQPSLGGQAHAAIPLLIDGHAIGVFGLSFVETRTFCDEDVAFMLSLAQQCAQALERARLYEASQEAIRARDYFYRRYRMNSEHLLPSCSAMPRFWDDV